MEECVSSLEETVTEPIVELVTDSLITVDGSMEACQDKVVIEGFSKQEGADLDETLTLVVKGFSYKKGVALDGLILAPPILDLSINEFVFMLGLSEFSVDFNSLFDRSNTPFLALYIDEFIIAGNLGQFMMWCEKMLTSEDGTKDKEGWQVADAVFLVHKIFTLKILKRV